MPEMFVSGLGEIAKTALTVVGIRNSKNNYLAMIKEIISKR